MGSSTVIYATIVYAGLGLLAQVGSKAFPAAQADKGCAARGSAQASAAAAPEALPDALRSRRPCCLTASPSCRAPGSRPC